MTAEEFNEAYALCNFLPGPNIVNFSVVFGRQVGGTVGALVALLGLARSAVPAGDAARPALCASYGDIAALQRILAGVAAAAAGLTISTGLKMAGPLLRQRPGFAHGLAMAAFLAVGILSWPIYWVLGVLIPCGIALAWWTAPMNSEIGTLLDPGGLFRPAVAVCDRRRQRGAARDAPPRRRGDALDERPAVRRHVRDRAGDAGTERHRGDAHRLSRGRPRWARWWRRWRCADRPACSRSSSARSGTASRTRPGAWRSRPRWSRSPSA